MARCAHCGRSNRDGSIFCQDCGRKLEPAAGKPATGAQPAAQAVTCPSCSTVNPAGMNFCKQCGTSLVGRAAAIAPKPATGALAEIGNAATGKVNCPSCAKQTPAGFAFCQHCGVRLAPGSATGRGSAAEAMAQTMAAAINPTPPAGMRPPNAFAPTIPPVSQPAMIADAPRARPSVSPVAIAAAARPSVVSAAAAAAAPATIREPAPEVTPIVFGSLVVLRRDGSDGETNSIESEVFDVGRLEGSLLFKDDPYLAPRHARFSFTGEGMRVRALDRVNGLYLRLIGPVDLEPGDMILLGKEVLRFELLGPEERDPPSLIEHSVRLLGSHSRDAWGRLRQITSAGTTRDVWHMTRPEFVIGREEGDVTFPDDEFMSRRHATVRRSTSGKPTLEDMESSNGTFVRLRGDHDLRPGDVLRMGDQLLRFES